MGSPFGIIGLILGILGAIVTWFLPFYIIILPILAIIFSAIGIAKDDSKAPGIIGLILGILGLIFWIVAIVLLAALFALLFSF